MNRTTVVNKPIPRIDRNRIGFSFEYDQMYLMTIHDIDFQSNPPIYEEWLRDNHVLNGYDMLIHTPKGEVKVEIKYSNYPIFHSWFLRDWYSRDCDVIVTNNKWNISSQDRQQLKERGIKLLNEYEFLCYILKLSCTPNKYTDISIDKISYNTNLDSHDLFIQQQNDVDAINNKMFLVLKKGGGKKHDRNNRNTIRED